MKNLILASAIMSALSVGHVHAQDSTAEHDISFNAAAVSDYRYRGISQSRLKPALQAGADYTHTPSGLYAGTWASSIRWIEDAGGNSTAEIDIYAGKRGDLGVGGLGYDVGALRYVYPSDELAINADTTELYAKLGFGPAYIKYSHSLTDLFGFADSANSNYIDVGADIEIGDGYIANLHAGYQRVKNNSDFDYSDWKVGVTKDFSLATASIAAVGTDTESYVGPAPRSRNLGKTGLVLSLSKTF